MTHGWSFRQNVISLHRSYFSDLELILWHRLRFDFCESELNFVTQNLLLWYRIEFY